jgi:hypothetical protein
MMCFSPLTIAIVMTLALSSAGIGYVIGALFAVGGRS